MNISVTLGTAGRVAESWETGVIKFFDPIRRWGFIIPDGDILGGQNVFLPWLTLRECGIAEALMRQNTRVKFRWRPPTESGRRPECIEIRVMHS